MSGVLAVIVLSVLFQARTPDGARPHPWDKPPVLIQDAQPKLPERTRIRAAISMEFRLQLDDKGHVVKAEIVAGAGGAYDKEVLAAVKRYLFRPAMKDGKPIACEMFLDLNMDPY